MIRLYAEFETEAEAETWVEGMYRSYPPLGYSTHLVISKVEHSRITGANVTRWVAHGSRAESCD
jgi:hypothetical protein